MRVEIFGQSRPQEGRQQTQNQDAYAIGHRPVPWAALCDGAGNAQTIAKRALGLLEAFFREASLGQMLQADVWLRWAKSLDYSLLSGPQTTLVAGAVIGDEVLGAAAGDSRAYLLPLEGQLRLLCDKAAKARLGSGEIEPAVFRARLHPRDVVVLLSDGAWSPLGSAGVERAIRSALAKHFAELPQAILDAASRTGRGDDMTAVALRLVAM